SYHLTAVMPLTGHEPKPLPKPKPQMVHAKLLPAVPVASPHLVVPREIRVAQPRPEPEPEAPKVVVNNFQPPQLKEVSGGARRQRRWAQQWPRQRCSYRRLRATGTFPRHGQAACRFWSAHQFGGDYFQTKSYLYG